jgi:hypothetical protein
MKAKLCNESCLWKAACSLIVIQLKQGGSRNSVGLWFGFVFMVFVDFYWSYEFDGVA